MFEATNQVLECAAIVYYPYNIMLLMWWSYVLVSDPKKLPVVPHKAVAEVSKIGSL